MLTSDLLNGELSLPYLRGGRHTRQHPALRPLGGPIARPHKAEGYENLPEALASFRSKGHRMLHNSLKSIWLRPRWVNLVKESALHLPSRWSVVSSSCWQRGHIGSDLTLIRVICRLRSAWPVSKPIRIRRPFLDNRKENGHTRYKCWWMFTPISVFLHLLALT